MDDINNQKPLTQIEKLKRSLFFKTKQRERKEIAGLNPKRHLVDSNWKKEKPEEMKKTKKSQKKKITFF